VRLLIVEDEPLISMHLTMVVESAGHEVVGAADSLASALAMAGEVSPESALVDINLKDGMTGPQIARRLKDEFGVAVGLVTGNAEKIPGDFSGALAAIDKPYTHNGIFEILAFLEASRNGGSQKAEFQHLRLPTVN
jgi:DNA-binding response OmpR family regulator